MKTAIEFSHSLFRRAKAIAVARGIALKHFFAVALKERLGRGAKEDDGQTEESPWMVGFGGLSGLGEDHRRVRETIQDEFGRIPPKSRGRPATHER